MYLGFSLGFGLEIGENMRELGSKIERIEREMDKEREIMDRTQKGRD